MPDKRFPMVDLFMGKPYEYWFDLQDRSVSMAEEIRQLHVSIDDMLNTSGAGPELIKAIYVLAEQTGYHGRNRSSLEAKRA